MIRLGAVIDPVAAVFRKQVRHLIRYPGELLFVLVLPYFFTVLIFGMGTFVGGANFASNFARRTGSTSINSAQDVLAYQFLGAAVWMMSWLVVESIGTSLRNEQVKGTLEQNFIAPINRFLLLLGESAAQVILSTVIFLVVAVASVGLLRPSDLPLLALAYGILVVGLIPMFGIGFIFAALVVRFKEPYAFTQAANVLFSVITGPLYSVTALPVWVQVVSGTLPQTQVIEAMRSIIGVSTALFNPFGILLILITMGVVYPFLGYRLFKAFERRAKVSGDLSKF